MSKNEEVARAHYAAFNRRAFDDGAALNAADVVWRNLPTGEQFVGRDGYKRFLSSWAEAMPDAKVEIERVVADERGVAVTFTGHGTFTGTMQTPAGPVPGTGKKLALPFCEVLAIEGGRIVRGDVYFDAATMMRQLGLA
jgi:steroid delta-isomerase-like uncharacterized protein